MVKIYKHFYNEALLIDESHGVLCNLVLAKCNSE